MGVNGVKRHKEKMLHQNNCETMRELIAKYRDEREESVGRTIHCNPGTFSGGFAEVRVGASERA